MSDYSGYPWGVPPGGQRGAPWGAAPVVLSIGDLQSIDQILVINSGSAVAVATLGTLAATWSKKYKEGFQKIETIKTIEISS